MRLAYFSPQPPQRSGIADYSASLLPYLRERHEIEAFEDNADEFDPGAFDVSLYQIGNNSHHALAYRTALDHPGVVVLHEANLHHLIAEMTIRRNDWDTYMREVEFDGGPAAAAYATRVRSLEVGPDYEGVPMLRRILAGARGVITHSHYVERIVQDTGYLGPLAVIPHGVSLLDADRMAYREHLGVGEDAPLVGIFGFLKPYKRVPECLRAFRRLAALEPQAKMILAGEEHPDLRLAPLIESLDLSAGVRHLGFLSIDDLDGYMAACDVILNLRHPTVGETSGTLMRALGLGRAVITSDIGAFAELPDDVCLKVAVEPAEEDLLFEQMHLLVTRPDLGRALGDGARCWVERECQWSLVADRYSCFLESVARGAQWRGFPDRATDAEQPSDRTQVDSDYLATWTGDDKGAREYLEIHSTRLEKTLEITPAGGPDDRILEMGAYMQITPALKIRLGYDEVRACYYGELGKVDRKLVRSLDGEEFECDLDLFDAEKDRFPYDDGYFSTVLCCELIEHLPSDPMHMMSEINRILRPDGTLVLTTPNITSLRAIAAILEGYHPGFFPAYIRPAAEGELTDARHNREYAPRELVHLLLDAGFETTLIETGPFRAEPKPEYAWVDRLLERYGLNTAYRDEGIYVVGRKKGPVRDRFPNWLYL